MILLISENCLKIFELFPQNFDTYIFPLFIPNPPPPPQPEFFDIASGTYLI